jgi:acyl-CoA synthetase (AMP-forming)/AMP-acid ligase II
MTATENAGATLPLPPCVTFRGRRWSAEALAGLAAAWSSQVRGSLTTGADAVAIVMQSHPETIALLFAASALDLPVVLLHPEPATWRSDPPFPNAMPVLIPPVAAGLEGALRDGGLSPMVVHDEPEPVAGGWPAFFATPGFVIFTSGSTGNPRPTFRSTEGLLQVARTIVRTYALPIGSHVAGCLPLATSFGLTQNILLPALLRGHVSLLERFQHRSLLALFEEEQLDYWPGTALMADVLVRAPLGAWAGRAPRICHISSGHVPEPVYRKFLDRFAVPLRQSYGRSECSFITSDPGPVEAMRPETVGFPSAGVEIRCGDSPEPGLPAGSAGRIWIRCPWHSEGYGYPPHLQPMARPDGWCPTEDLGMVNVDGRLVLLGRMDDCFKTAGGHLVSPPLIVAALRRDPRVIDATVVPVRSRSGAAIGIVAVACDAVGAADIRAHVANVLPRWLRPAAVVVRREIPSLPSGKHDRVACIRLLEAEMARDVRSMPA